MLLECKKATVYDLDKYLIGDVGVEVIDEDSVLLIFTEEMIDSLRTEALVTFYDATRGLVTCLCNMTLVTKSEQDLELPYQYAARCQIIEERGIIQRRSDVKIKVSFPVEITGKDAKEKEFVIKAKMRDISAGGIAFISSERLPKGQEFVFSFTKGETPIDLTGKVLRIMKSEDVGEKLGTDSDGNENIMYGCCFTNMNLTKETAVRRYVYKEQLRRFRFIE